MEYLLDRNLTELQKYKIRNGYVFVFESMEPPENYPDFQFPCLHGFGSSIMIIPL